MAEPKRRCPRDEGHAQSHLQDVAFTMHGSAAEIPGGIFEAHDSEPITITAYPFTSIAYRVQLKKQGATESHSPPSSVERSKLDAEVEDAESAHFLTYLVVGLVYPGLDTALMKPKLPKQMPVGSYLPPKEYIKRFDPEGVQPLVAVVPVVSNTTKLKGIGHIAQQVKTYVLLKSEQDRHCTPYIVSQQEVFYIPAYRDNTTAKVDRGPSWNGNVVQKLLELNSTGSEDVTAHQRGKGKVRDSASLANRLSTYAAALRHKLESWYVDELKAALDSADPDLEYRPLPVDEKLLALIDGVETLSAEQAEDAIHRLGIMWPELDYEQVTAQAVISLDEAYKSASKEDEDFIVDYRLIRGFVAEGARRLSTTRGRSDYASSPAEFARDVYRSVTCITPPPESKPSVPGTGTDSLLLPMRSYIRQLIETSASSDTSVPESAGHATMGESSTSV